MIRDETGTQRLLGYVLDVGQGDGAARCWLDITPAHLNRHGVLHGGVAAALLDNASGATASLSVDETGRAPFLTVSLSIAFVAPAEGGRVMATGQKTGGGRGLVFVEARLEHEDGRLIATSSGVFKRVRQ